MTEPKSIKQEPSQNISPPQPMAGPGSLWTGGPQFPQQRFSAFASLSQFKDAQRMAMMLAHSSIVPKLYRGEEQIGNCVIALEIANRIGASVLAVMQNLQLVQDRLGWSTQFLISCLNATRRFSPIRYQMTGAQGEDSLGCVAWAVDKSGESLKSPEVTIKMAKDEGWYYRPGSKWRSMPELMLCYRSATLFTRLYAPEISMGIQTTDEVLEIGPAGNLDPCRPVFQPRPAQPMPESNPQIQLKQDVPINLLSSAGAACQAIDSAATSDSAVDSACDRTAAQGEGRNGRNGQYNYLKALSGLIGLSNHCEADVLMLLHKGRRCDESLASLAEVNNQQPSAIIWAHDNWHAVEREITRLKKHQVL